VFELPIELIERARPLPESISFSELSAVIAMRPRCERCRQHTPLKGFEMEKPLRRLARGRETLSKREIALSEREVSAVGAGPRLCDA